MSRDTFPPIIQCVSLSVLLFSFSYRLPLELRQKFAYLPVGGGTVNFPNWLLASIIPENRPGLRMSLERVLAHRLPTSLQLTTLAS